MLSICMVLAIEQPFQWYIRMPDLGLDGVCEVRVRHSPVTWVEQNKEQTSLSLLIILRTVEKEHT